MYLTIWQFSIFIPSVVNKLLNLGMSCPVFPLPILCSLKKNSSRFFYSSFSGPVFCLYLLLFSDCHVRGCTIGYVAHTFVFGAKCTTLSCGRDCTHVVVVPQVTKDSIYDITLRIWVGATDQTGPYACKVCPWATFDFNSPYFYSLIQILIASYTPQLWGSYWFPV